jgi:hypothetical protein
MPRWMGLSLSSASCRRDLMLVQRQILAKGAQNGQRDRLHRGLCVERRISRQLGQRSASCHL